MSLLKQLCPITQRYNLKAIHNVGLLIEILLTVVSNNSKIQFESNSQHANIALFPPLGCVQ